MENGSNSFFPCSWDGGAACRAQPAAGAALDLLRGGSRGCVCGVCVCVQVEELNKEEFLTLLHCLQS